MTEQEIDALPAGDDLDWAVAEQVLGWRQRMRFVTGELIGFEPPSDEGDRIIAHVPKFSTEIAAAFLVWDKCAVGERWHLRSDEDGAAILVDRGEYRAEPVLDEAARAATIPLAICRAALRRYRPLTRYWTR